MDNATVKISPIARSIAQQTGLPDYFLSGEIGLACGSLDVLTVNWSAFTEARVHENRIVVLHADLVQKGWLLSDFITGVQIVGDRTKVALWRKLDSLHGWADKLAGYPLTNTRSFMSAYWSVVMLVKNATPAAKQAMLCACRDIAGGRIDY